MEAKELRQLKKEELETKIIQWREELFRNRFKAQTAEAKDTSVFLKLKRDIARGLTILQETKLGIVRNTVAAADAPVKAKAAPKKATKKAPAKAKDSGDK